MPGGHKVQIFIGISVYILETSYKLYRALDNYDKNVKLNTYYKTLLYKIQLFSIQWFISDRAWKKK